MNLEWTETVKVGDMQVTPWFAVGTAGLNKPEGSFHSKALVWEQGE